MFQIVCVAFGLRNVSDTDRGLREMARVCRPGGSVAVLEFSMPTLWPLGPLYGWYFHRVLPRIGQALARNDQSAYNYLPASVSQFPQGEELVQRMRAAGLAGVEQHRFTLGIATLYVGRNEITVAAPPMERHHGGRDEYIRQQQDRFIMKRNIVVAITGASGVVYATRLLEVLHAAGCDIHLIISPAAQTVFKQELDLTVDLENFSPSMLMLDIGSKPKDRKLQILRAMRGISSDESNVLAVGSGEEGKLIYYHYRDYMGAIASGSFLTDGMVICPCSSGTFSAIVHGTSANLIHRTAEVHFKERRKLILVPRETPLSLTVLDNMKRAAEYGA